MKSEYILTLLLSVLIGYLLYLVMLPFFVPIFQAAVLAILFYPFYLWLRKEVVANSSVASLIACVVIAVFLIAPMGLLAVAIVNELFNLYQWAEGYMKGLSMRAHNSPVFIFPYLQRFFEKYINVSAIDMQAIFLNSIKEIATYAAEGIKGFIKNFAEFFFNLFLAFFTLYFLFKDGDKLVGLVKDLLPLSPRNKERLIERNRRVISATFTGGVLVGAIQGLLGGLAFWVLELPSALLWGSVMFILSFLPGFGTALIWLPAAIYFFIMGSYIKGIILILWGTFVVGLVDNFLRPVLVSGRTDLHPMLLFFSIIGAVNVFGLIGIIAGPLILSIAHAMVDIYHEERTSRNTWAG